MTEDEIKGYLHVGREKTVCVERRLLVQYGDIVRTTEIRKDFLVQLSFENWGSDEGGAYFSGQYESFKEVIKFLETYFGRPLAAWENYTKSGGYPEKPLRNNTKGDIEFRKDIKKRAIELPVGTLFKMQKNYWYYI